MPLFVIKEFLNHYVFKSLFDIIFVSLWRKNMIKCKFLEQYRIPTVTLNGGEYMESERCRLGNEIPLGGCLDNCPDFEPVM